MIKSPHLLLPKLLRRARRKPFFPTTVWARPVFQKIRGPIGLGAFVAALTLIFAIWASPFAAVHSEGSAATEIRQETSTSSEVPVPTEAPPPPETPTPEAEQAQAPLPDDQQNAEADQ